MVEPSGATAANSDLYQKNVSNRQTA